MRKEPFIYGVTFLVDGSFGIISLCIPLVALKLGASYDDLGSIGALDAGVYAASCLLSGRLADRLGYRRSATLASLLIACVAAAYTQISTLLHIYILAACHGLVFSGFWPSILAWLGQGKSPAELLRSTGRFNIAWSSGMMAGPLLGGALYAFDPQTPFWLTASIIACVFLGLWFLPRFSPNADHAGRSDLAPRPGARRYLAAAWVANFSTYFTLASLRHLFPKYATDLGVAPGRLGVLLACIGIAQLVTFGILGRTERWQFRFSPLAGGQLLGIAGLGCIIFGSRPALFALGLLMVGVAVGITYSASLYYSLHTPDQAGGRTGAHESIIGAGFLFGPLIGGFAAEHIGARVPYLLAGCVTLFAILVEYALIHRHELRFPSRPV